jgi:hypothetical protein
MSAEEKQLSQSDDDAPVAYDVDGRPLYAHSSINQPQTEMQPRAVHLVRPIEPEKQVISESTKLKHQQSKLAFPDCDISEGEYIISSINRHPVGLLFPFVLGVFLIALASALFFNYDLIAPVLNIPKNSVDSTAFILPFLSFVMLIIVGMYVMYYVYTNNKLYLTNESVIQEVQTSVLSKKEQVVVLIDIEDVSYTQSGVIEKMFNVGSIRLSTEGEGTVYYFKFVPNPREVISMLKDAVEAFKAGRAINY